VLRLQPSVQAPSVAREAVRQAAGSRYAADVRDAAELLTSEIVTNAVTHGSGMVTVVIECEDGALAVAVGDDAPSLPVVRPEETLDVGGRGMQLVQILAGEWSVQRRADGDGKVVWFRLP